MKIKPWRVEIQTDDSNRWMFVAHFFSRTAGGAIAQFARDITKHVPDCVAVRALEKTS